MDAYEWENLLMAALVGVCLLAAPVLIGVGARAAGLAMIGALVGSFIGMQIVASNIDSLPTGAVVGGTIGSVATGSLGLMWKSPSAARPILVKIAWATAVVGGIVVALAYYFSEDGCHAHGRALPCLPHTGPWFAPALALNVTTVVLLLLLQLVTVES